MEHSLSISTLGSQISTESLGSPSFVPGAAVSEVKVLSAIPKRRNRVRIEGHRGAGSLEPENSMKAFQRAIDEGFDGVELDVWVTADGIPVVVHGTDEGLIYFKDSTLDTFAHLMHSNDIKDRRLKNDELIPTLEEVLLLCKDKIKVNIEFKEENERVVKPTLELVQKLGLLDQVCFSSFLHRHKDRLEEARRELSINQRLEFGFLVWQFDGFGEWRDRAMEGDTLNIDMDLLAANEEFILKEMAAARELKMRLKFYFCFHYAETNEIYKKLEEMDVDTLIVNQPIQGRAFYSQAE